MNFKELRQYANPRQRQIMDAYEAHGSARKAAHALGITHQSVSSTLRRVKKAAALRGYPDVPVREGMVLKGQSALVDQFGNEKGRWDKTTREGMDPEEAKHLADPKILKSLSTYTDAEGRVIGQWAREVPEEQAKEAAWRAFAEELQAGIKPADPVIMTSVQKDQDLLACYPVGDHHMGMLAWSKETGASYDLDIGENLLTSAMDYLSGAMVEAGSALVAFLGDFMHYDSFAPVTPTSRNQLDTDTRYPKMIRASVRAMRYTIDAALKRHGRVRVIVEIGNHDLSSMVFATECLRLVYENEPRVSIDDSPRHYHYYSFGRVLIGTHHGHGSKLADLPLIMATDQPEKWGRSKHRYIWTGHVHHSHKGSVRPLQTQKDFPGVEVESFRILPPGDAWANQNGYRAARDMKAILMHAEHGEAMRLTVRPEMLTKKKETEI